ncbi:DUF4430 domain-containing protein [Parvibacter caecicola]|uniref:DUF4430 domain-containing protein n=1 Tax=Parvibacter caecicola TaxID=747645 RepID=A0A3N0ABG9_9ACTN|nr:DUF4430 domain-containing protein [Parvibacter caecicola]MBB3171353.1 hypothetical protein [Parvibacter caecicola]MCR2041230.1 DUF4430 domain-containing protein [Parvibacter caecicola]RNL11584.1 hypothetical protein DMP11_02220 [Parvibacter caecicola]TJW10818.1 DUF4430 domain-containing protein [Parvibacter caecicola]
MLKASEMKKRCPRAMAWALLLALALTAAPLLGGCSGEPASTDGSGAPAAQPAEQAAGPQEPGEADDSAVTGADKITVSVEVMSATDEGAALYSEEMAVDQGTSALGALKITGLQVSVEESDYGPFVTAIGSTANEGSSGWTYTVNGESPTVAADQTELQAGDKLVWEYVTF